MSPEPRDLALAALYQADLTGEPGDLAEMPARARRLVEGVLANLASLDDAISAVSDHWSIERMPVLDRTILRLGLYELRHLGEVPAVVVNEAVRLAKTYSTQRSGAFVNGVLAALAEQAGEDEGYSVMDGTAVLDAADIRRAVHRIAHEIVERHHGAGDLVLVGIHTRGVPLAAAIAAAIADFEGRRPLVGELDIGLYRDDLAERSRPRLARTALPGDVTGRALVLVDDVLFTGRTIRAALDALTDLGRPARVELAVLVDRGHRQLPIRPDYVGRSLPTTVNQRVAVRLAEVDGVSGVWLCEAEGER